MKNEMLFYPLQNLLNIFLFNLNRILNRIKFSKIFGDHKSTSFFLKIETLKEWFLDKTVQSSNEFRTHSFKLADAYASLVPQQDVILLLLFLMKDLRA